MLRPASVFFIDIATLCVMSNHYHIQLHVRRDDAIAAALRNNVQRAHQLIAGTEVSRKYVKDKHIEPWEHERLNSFVDTWRKRLFDICWFMKSPNKGIAPKANKDGDCTGHFWVARYNSQALLDEKAVLSCMS